MTGEVDYVVLNDVIKTSNVVDTLIAEVPECRDAMSDVDRDQTYLVFGRFARSIEELVRNRTLSDNDAVLRRAFRLVNRLAEIHGEMENLVEVEIIPVLADSNETTAAGRELLADRARSWLEERIGRVD